MIKYLVFLAFSAFLAGCGAVYSPSLHLPEKPLPKNDGQVTLGYGVMNDVNGPGSIHNDGTDLQLRYGFSDRFSLSVKGWSSSTLISQGFYNGGFLTNAVIALNDKDESTNFAIIPTWNLLFDNSGVSASGASVQGAVWLPTVDKLRMYIASGPGFIANDFDEDEWGYGLISNAGLTFDLQNDLFLNGEVSTMLAHKVSTNENYLSLGVMLGMSWNFHN